MYLDPKWAASSARRFLAAESSLRAMHGLECVYVRPQAVASEAWVLAAAGWAFLDGNPAILPHHLDLLVVSAGADGLGRNPVQVFELLAPYTTQHRKPVPHLAVRIPEADRPRLFDAIARLPDHSPKFPSRPPRLLDYAPELPPAERAALEQEASSSSLPMQHRMLSMEVPFMAINQAVYATGLRSLWSVTELEPEHAGWGPPGGGSSYSDPQVSYGVDRSLGVKVVVLERMAPRDLAGLPWLTIGAIDLAPHADPVTLARNLAQLKWMTAAQPGWDGVPGAIVVRGTTGGDSWFGYDCPPELHARVAALRAVADPTVAAAATDLLKHWDAQSSILRG